MTHDPVPWWIAVSLFIGAAALVWQAGSRLPAQVVRICERTGLGHGLAGLLLLGSITSLPELATATGASAMGAPLLALNNILGSASFNLLILAFADLVIDRRPLTSAVARPVVLVQGVLGMLLLVVTAIAILVNGGGMATPVGPWSLAILVLCIAAIAISNRAERRPMWLVTDPVLGPEERGTPSLPGRFDPYLVTAGLAAAIMAGGMVLAWSAREIAGDSGLGEGPVGFLFAAAATSLPEVSGVVGALRARHYELAVGEIFGSNLFNIAIIFAIDLASPAGPVMSMAGDFEILGALLGAVMTGVYLLALIERRDGMYLRLGEGAIATVILYVLGTTALFGMKGA